MKKIISILCLIAVLGLALFSACTPPQSCTNHVDENHDSKCDVCDTVMDTSVDEMPEDYVDPYYRADAGVNYNKSNGYLVQNGATTYQVVIPDEPTATETYAANEFSAYFKELTGVEIDVISDVGRSYNTNDAVISIGKTVYQKGADLSDVDYDNLNGDGFITKSFGKVYVLDAASKDGLIYSAYNFLEIFFGLEFISWRYTYMPEVPNEVPAYETDIIDIPAFADRDAYAHTVFYAQGGAYLGAKLRNNSSQYAHNDVLDKNRYFTYYYGEDGVNDSFGMRMGHTNTYYLAVDAYRNGYNPTPLYKLGDNGTDDSRGGASKNWPLGYYNYDDETNGSRNDWYAWSPGVRNNADGYSQEELCYSNGLTMDGEYDENAEDSLVDKFIEICKTMILDPRNCDATALMLGHGDYEAKCQCEKCQHITNTYGNGVYNTTIICFANVISEKIAEWMEEEGIDREVNFVIFAYSKSIEAPVIYNDDGTITPYSDKVVCNDNVAIQMAWRYCSYHTLWDEECEWNGEKRDQFNAWTQLASKVEIWDYYGCVFYNSLWYNPGIGAIKDQYQYYTTIGVNRVLTQGCPNMEDYYQYVLTQYVALKLMWNSNRDVNQLIKDFNRMYFTEKYAHYVDTYLDIFENHIAMLDATMEGGVHFCTYQALDNENQDVFTKEILQQLIDLLNEAIAEAEEDTTLSVEQKEQILFNLRSVIITPQYMMLQFNYIVDRAELTALATDFFYNIEACGLINKTMAEGTGPTFQDYKESFGL